jgi:hypothetical protein
MLTCQVHRGLRAWKLATPKYWKSVPVANTSLIEQAMVLAIKGVALTPTAKYGSMSHRVEPTSMFTELAKRVLLRLSAAQPPPATRNVHQCLSQMASVAQYMFMCQVLLGLKARQLATP